MDRISVLPKTILHDILGRLPDKDAARTSVLSKSWRETWFSFPILAACINDYFSLLELQLPPEDPLWLSKLDTFIEYVSKRLRRLHDQGLAIKELKLNMEYKSDSMLVSQSHHIDKWIQMASESGVEVLQLHLTHSSDKFYNLPLCLAEAKSLTKLVLSGGIRLDPAFLNRLKFFSVRTLLFCGILLGDERVMEHLISHCPLVEHLTLIGCLVYKPLSVGNPPGSRAYFVKSLSLHGLKKLKGADVQGIEEVYIDAPNIENLFYHGAIADASFKLNLGSYKNLRWLSLCFVRRADIWLLERLPKIPFLESLMLKNCSLSERINISGPQLKFFKLSCCCNLKEVNIDAPNLLSCEYVGKDKPVISFCGISSQLEVNARIHMNHEHVDRLRQFIQNIEPQEVLKSLSLFIIQPYSIIKSLGTLQGSSSPPSIKHMQLCSISHRQTQYFPVMNWLLSSCFPETISFSLHCNFNMRAFMVYFYEMLMGSKKGECYCYSRGPECWWHGLKVVKITHLERTYENVEDFKAMLNALPLSDNYEEEFITFTLEL